MAELLRDRMRRRRQARVDIRREQDATHRAAQRPQGEHQVDRPLAHQPARDRERLTRRLRAHLRRALQSQRVDRSARANSSSRGRGPSRASHVHHTSSEQHSESALR